ncbi:MAG TPA: alpha/beta fold hydrolase [Pyrinomonadaceae bacterium]|nr:alpha/beta fold hydrolase [Pyrinomonadaceae bacterium]
MKLSTRILMTLLFAALFLSHAAAARAQIPARADKPTRSFLSRCSEPEFKTKAWCGRYEVFENRASKQGRKIALNVVILPALSEKPSPDAVFFLAGGPGQGAASLAAYIGEALPARVRQERDIVFIDQRGTGESNPLNCNLYNDDDLQGYFEEMFPAKAVRDCRARLERVADLTQYTTNIAIDDLDEVRRSLGYEKINLYGGSYGTTVALAYLQRYGAHVRSAVLAGVATLDFKLPLPFAKGAQLAMDGLMRDCEQDAACRQAFPKLREEFRAVLERLLKGAVSVEVVNPMNGQSQSISLSRGPFTERLRMMLYGHNTARLVPALIHSAYQGDFKPFILASLPQARATYQSLSLGMYFTVTCTEGVQLITEEDIKRETEGTFIGDYRVRVHQRACREWPRGELPNQFTSTFKSDVPVLMLSGELDPASPRRFASELVRQLPNGLQLNVPFGGHGYFSECISDITADFISRGTVRGLSASCLQSAKRPPFATTLTEALSLRR